MRINRIISHDCYLVSSLICLSEAQLLPCMKILCEWKLENTSQLYSFEIYVIISVLHNTVGKLVSSGIGLADMVVNCRPDCLGC